MTRTSFDEFSTTSEQYLRPNEGCVEKLIGLDLPNNAPNQNQQLFPNSYQSKDCTKTNLEKEDLIQLDASPKRRVRIRKPKIINNKNYMFEADRGYGTSGSTSSHTRSTKNNLQPNESASLISAANSNSILAAIQNATYSSTNNITPTYNSGTKSTVGVGNKDSTSDIQKRLKSNATSEILGAPTSVILAKPSRQKDKLL